MTEHLKEHILFNSIYPLNGSCSKMLFVGLQQVADCVYQFHYEPVVKLLSNNFEGIKFSMNSWMEMTESFVHIDQYFKDADNCLDGKIISGSGWILRFVHNDSNKAIEIEGNECTSNRNSTQIFKEVLVMGREIIETMFDISYTVQLKLKYLKSVAINIPHLSQIIIDDVKCKGESRFDSQITYSDFWTADFVKNIANIDSDSEEEFDKIFKTLRDIVKEDQHIMYINEIKILYHELIFFNASQIANILNENIEKN